MLIQSRHFFFINDVTENYRYNHIGKILLKTLNNAHQSLVEVVLKSIETHEKRTKRLRRLLRVPCLLHTLLKKLHFQVKRLQPNLFITWTHLY